MGQNGLKMSTVVQNGQKIVQNSFKWSTWSQMVPNGLKHSQMVQKGPKRCEMVPNDQNGPKLSKIVQNGPKYPKYGELETFGG